ncbi:MAG: YihA family ribosome biogenesis GTP-binding protein [Lachnospiraceae bacterium]|nr:YihA family ribosome biogenesis GTP-binding protein [Clostridia bacterium]MBP3542597.1 YihA family ribosome biogenesis GTP-binding protein [Lachnospiraceae bacterium]
MNIHNVSLTISAVQPKQYPHDDIPEIAFAGRSNVGKSSFINKVLNRKSLARTSSKPGKTATINFFNIDDCLNFVDLPGYGFARVSKEEKKKWGEMIETYLNSRGNLSQVILLVDSRHAPTPDDHMMLNFIRAVCDRVVIVASKIDKLKKSERTDSLRRIITELKLNGDDVIIPFSAVTGEGADMFWDYVNEVIMNDCEE